MLYRTAFHEYVPCGERVRIDVNTISLVAPRCKHNQATEQGESHGLLLHMAAFAPGTVCLSLHRHNPEHSRTCSPRAMSLEGNKQADGSAIAVFKSRLPIDISPRMLICRVYTSVMRLRTHVP